MEGKVVAVRQLDGEPLCLFEVRNVPEKNDTLADEASGVERDPNGIPEPGREFDWYRRYGYIF